MKIRNQNKIADKIKNLEELSRIVNKLKIKGQQIVHCHGVFDLMHPGHIKHLESAKREGDILVVTITPDRYVNKGPGRPIFNEMLRAETIAALQCVDFVAINKWPTAVETIKLIKPDIYVKGQEYADHSRDITGKITEEEEAVSAVGGRIHYTDDITFSSSSLINAYFSVFPAETAEWLKTFKLKYPANEIIKYLDGMKKMKVLVIGEAIIDEYLFCDGLGKSNKDPILAFKYQYTESYAGGSLAVANHLANFCSEVGLVTLLGETDRKEEFIRTKLAPNINPVFITHAKAPTIHKRRFVDNHTAARMFEIYLMDDLPLKPEVEETLLKKVTKIIKDYDLVVVVDYGHGMMTPALVKLICRKAPFLCVNTQSNAGNRGFNTISKYPRADYVCLAGHEIALETRMRHAGWRELIMEVIRRIKCSSFTVTLGKDGSTHYAPSTGFIQVPALATKVMDRVGAGDAVFAITSVLVKQKAPWETVGFIGNVAGAQMVAELGNRVSLNKVNLAKNIVALLK